MSRLVVFCMAWAVALATGAVAQAHFVFLVAGPSSPDGKVHVYFSEEAEPDNPELLKRLNGIKVYEVRNGEAQEVALALDKDSLAATPAASGSAVYLTSFNYGVLAKGDAPFLLNYHAKAYNSADPRFWTPVLDAKQLPLEIQPRIDGNELVLQVLWNGKPLGEAEVTITREGADDVKGTTDKRSGSFRTEIPAGALCSIRVKHVEKQSGEQDGKAYSEARHYSTLSLKMPAEVAVKQVAALPHPVTSFGAAIVGDDVYVYGGHLGSPHHYSTEGQSDHFLRLNLKNPAEGWKELASVPKKTGLAMVPYQGRIYRIGGFEATNKESEDQVLVSTADVAMYDPATNAWTDLTPLPAGRSSHDAVVIGDKLYVVGGWNMQPGQDTVWHSNGLVADLTQPKLEWKEFAVPFQRRALSVGEWQGRLVAIGGMQEKGGPSTQVSIYDPTANAWTDGPSIQGQPMDGFGSSAFLCGNDLYVSTMSGTLQCLSKDGSRWNVVAQLHQPRFFHRMLPQGNNSLLILGGASMEKGKLDSSEWIATEELSASVN
ncbi:MAG: hypothetical protein KF777_03485 [Planctomycetaceae bacterium]|nr:hypothetical protein [Planctomycetaceae bacterium]